MKADIDFSPLSKDILVSSVLDFVKNELKIYNPVAIYVAGSHLRRWNKQGTSDFDIVVLVRESHRDILLGNYISRHQKFFLSDVKIDVLVKGFSELYKMLFKGDIPMTEIFAESPIWITNLKINKNAIYEINELQKKKRHKALMYIGLSQKVYAASGFLKKTEKLFKKGKTGNAAKNLSTIALWIAYVDQIITEEKFPDPGSEVYSQANSLRERFDNGEISKKETKEEFIKLAEQCQQLKEKYSENEKKLFQKTTTAKFSLSKHFVDAMG